MAKRDSFLLRVDPQILEAIRRWSEDELRSMNAQIEYILRSKLQDAGRLPQKESSVSATAAQPASPAEFRNLSDHPPNDDAN